MPDKGNSTAGKDQIGDKKSLAEAYVVKDPEIFARNIARMLEELGKAASAWVEPREKGEVSDTVSEPMTDMVKTFSKVGEYWLSDPKRAIEAQTSLLTGYFGMWSDSIRRMSGEDDTPKKKKHRQAFFRSRLGRQSLLRIPQERLLPDFRLGQQAGGRERRA